MKLVMVPVLVLCGLGCGGSGATSHVDSGGPGTGGLAAGTGGTAGARATGGAGGGDGCGGKGRRCRLSGT